MSTTVIQQNEGKDATRQQPPKLKLSSGLLRKFTTKLKPLTLQPKSPISAVPSPTTQRPAVPIAPTDVVAIKRRHAALQQCGLAPKDLSQLERELDRRFSQVVVPPQDQPEQGELSSAEKIRSEWRTKNETRPENQGDDLDTKDPSDITSDSLDVKSNFPRNAEERNAPLLNLASPVSLYSIPGTFSFSDIPEEDATGPEIEKELPSIPPVETVDPLSIPLPDSPLSSSLNLSEILPTPSPRDNKRLPPIVIDHTTNYAKGDAEDVTRGRSLSIHSLTTKSSSPALSPTMTASSYSTIPTPRDDESRERMESTITRSSGGKSRPPRFGRLSDVGRDSDDLDVVHETIPESPEPTPTEPGTWNPNRESAATMGSAGFEAFVEKKEKRKITGIFSSNKRSPVSSSSELGSMWSIITNDFSLKPLDGGRSRSSTLLSTPTSTDENREVTPTPSRVVIQPPRSKISRSRSMISSLGLRMSRKKAPRSAATLAPPSPTSPSPMRRPTVRIVQNRESLLQDVKGIEDDESRRLTELAFMDF